MNLLVNIDVDDLDRAVRFYAAALGLSVGRRLGDDAVEMLGGSSPIYLLRKAGDTLASPGAAASTLRTYDRHWTPVHLDVVVEAIGPAVERAVSAGARLEQPVTSSTWGRLALMADPFGHGFCLVEFVGRGYDAIATQTQVTDWSTCPAVERGPAGGAWVFRGTEVPIAALFEYLEDGEELADFLEWFPDIPEQQVRAVLEHTGWSDSAAS